MRVWRLCKAKNAKDAFSGEGARLHGGRWNYRGIPVVYTSESRALAALELRVHTPQLVRDLVLIGADLPDALPVTRLRPEDLPMGWDQYPAPEELKGIGMTWIEQGANVALVVPSVVIPSEHNIVLNPRHPDFPSIQIREPEPFLYDHRLF
jgi:RES domain-containing protein